LYRDVSARAAETGHLTGDQQQIGVGLTIFFATWAIMIGSI
jgi:hypothetical protein